MSINHGTKIVWSLSMGNGHRQAAHESPVFRIQLMQNNLSDGLETDESNMHMKVRSTEYGV